MRKGFTLVELIVVIAIIAILAVSAGMMLTKWIGKSKDARVVADINTIDKAMQVHYAEEFSYPNPNTANGWTIIVPDVGYGFTQWELDETVISSMDSMEKTPKTPSENNYYYSKSNDNKYQLAWESENSGWVVRWSYGYAAVVSWTDATSVDVVELPSLFVTNGSSLTWDSTYDGTDTFDFIVDGASTATTVPYFFTGSFNLDTGDFDALEGAMTNPLNVTTWALQAQLQAQVE